ncbi:PepSY-associated TM helix domain-containing protein [Allopusillimonas ginsengisoli]|uniref:PepSY-associated TM helix domain-containing protein n=1 Tax=Allopusillimonas ginsengisoli TaxID=453575 RepID=UPI0010216169|nr:PepSY domain-containing protein [Allopusillimonas ginsengisoli]TEA79620.1 PepSY domain-containing protein [Allopusillimonas ginsengisoli]
MTTPKPTGKKSRSKLWFLVHSWLALPIWVFVFFVCLTGSIATISQEILWLANPAVRANPPSDNAPLLGYDAILAKVSQEHPGAVVRSISRPVKSQFALTVRVSYPDARSAALYVNPYTGHIQGEESGFDFRQFVRALHGWLLMPFNSGFSIGWYLVSLLAIPMLGSLVTGLVVYKRFWRGFLKPRLRVGQGARIFWGDFHRLAGIWSIPFIAIIAITSIWFLTRAILFDFHISFSTEGVPPVVARADVPDIRPGEPKPIISLDRAAEIAHETFPDLKPSFVSLPGNAFSHYEVGGRGSYPLLFETLSINPYTGAVENTRRVSDRSGLELFTESMRPLHTGDFAGLWLKLVYFFFGVLLTMMVFSGMMIWTKRTIKETAAAIRGPSRSARARHSPPSVHAQPVAADTLRLEGRHE